MRQELAVKSTKIAQKIHPNTQNLIEGLLERDQNKRFDIEQVLAHKAIKSKQAEFEKGISKPDFMLLIANYMVNKEINTLSELPESILKLSEKDFEEKTEIVKKIHFLGNKS